MQSLRLVVLLLSMSAVGADARFGDRNISINIPGAQGPNSFTAAYGGGWLSHTHELLAEARSSGHGISTPFAPGDATASQTIDLQTFQVKCDGSTNDSAALSRASAALRNKGGTLVIPSGSTCLIGTSVTLDEGVSLRFEAGGKFSVSAGATLTIKGDISAGHYRIFQYNGTGIVSFAGNTKLGSVYPEWWGALGNDDGSANGNDDTSAINGMFAAVRTAPAYHLPTVKMRGRYKITAGIDAHNFGNASFIEIRGEPHGQFQCYGVTNLPALNLGGSKAHVSGITINSGDHAGGQPCLLGLALYRTSAANSAIGFSVFEHFAVSGAFSSVAFYSISHEVLTLRSVDVVNTVNTYGFVWASTNVLSSHRVPVPNAALPDWKGISESNTVLNWYGGTVWNFCTTRGPVFCANANAVGIWLYDGNDLNINGISFFTPNDSIAFKLSRNPATSSLLGISIINNRIEGSGEFIHQSGAVSDIRLMGNMFDYDNMPDKVIWNAEAGANLTNCHIAGNRDNFVAGKTPYQYSLGAIHWCSIIAPTAIVQSTVGGGANVISSHIIAYRVNLSGGLQEIRDSFVQEAEAYSSGNKLGGLMVSSPVREWVMAVKAITSTDSPYTVTSHDAVLAINASAGDIVIHLPAIGGSTKYAASARFLWFFRTDNTANKVTFTPAAGNAMCCGITFNAKYKSLVLSSGNGGMWQVWSNF